MVKHGAILFLWIPAWGVAGAAWPAEPPRDNGAAVRRYEDGPLTAADYQGVPPEDSGRLLAWTTTDLRYHYRCQYNWTDQRAEAFLTEITIDAVLVPSRSWLKRASDRRLMDHEQGHFDLTMIATLRARVYFAEQLSKRRLQVTARTQEETLVALKNKVAEEMKPFLDGMAAEQAEYDRVTHHGTIPEQQARHRETQLEALKSLNGRLQSLQAQRRKTR